MICIYDRLTLLYQILNKHLTIRPEKASIAQDSKPAYWTFKSSNPTKLAAKATGQLQVPHPHPLPTHTHTVVSVTSVLAVLPQ